MTLLRVLTLAVLLVVACSALSVASSTPIQYRKDYYLNGWEYPEPWNGGEPKGGRVFVILNSSVTLPNEPFTVDFTASGNSYSVPITDNTDVQSQTNNHVDWVRCHAATSSNRLVVSFHSSVPSYLASLAQISVKDGSGRQIASASVQVPAASNNGFAVSYVAQEQSLTTMVVHLHNYATSGSVTVNRLIVNGQDVQVNGITLDAGAHQVVTVPSNGVKLSVAFVWTVETLVTENGQQRWVGNGGRLGHNSWANMGWQHSSVSNCPWPNTNPSTYDSFTKVLGLNAFWGWGWQNCGIVPQTILPSAVKNGIKLNLQSSQTGFLMLNYTQQETDGILSWVLGDEVDNHLDNMGPNWRLAIQSMKYQKNSVTYQGGKTNSWIGKFAGVADVQGLDFYVAGCAPHITPAITPMKLRGAYDYLRNARNNQMPLSFMGYTQGLCTKCWKETPSAAEVIVQIGMALASGTKGLYVFMADIAAAKLPQYPVVGEMIKSCTAVGELIRTGDVEGAKVTTSDGNAYNTSSIVEVISSPNNTFLVVAVNLEAGGYNDLVCEIDPFMHWTFAVHTISQVTAVVNTELGTSPTSLKVEEARDGQVQPLAPGTATFSYNAASKTISIQNLQIESGRPTRVFKVTLQ